MVPVRIDRIVVAPETLVRPIVMLPYGFPGPAVTLDSEMVVSFNRQIGIAVVRFKTGLCKSDARRYAGFAHLLNGHAPIFLYIGGTRICFLCGNGCAQGKQQQKYDKTFLHILTKLGKFVQNQLDDIPVFCQYRIGEHRSRFFQKWFEAFVA